MAVDTAALAPSLHRSGIIRLRSAQHQRAGTHSSLSPEASDVTSNGLV